MSVQNPDVIDGVGLDDTSTKVVMLVSDHLSWDDSSHVPLLASKIETYASAALSGQLVESYPPSKGKPVSIRLIYRELPNDEALCFLTSIERQLKGAGIGFEHMPLPHDY